MVVTRMKMPSMKRHADGNIIHDMSQHGGADVMTHVNPAGEGDVTRGNKNHLLQHRQSSFFSHLENGIFRTKKLTNLPWLKASLITQLIEKKTKTKHSYKMAVHTDFYQQVHF